MVMMKSRGSLCWWCHCCIVGVNLHCGIACVVVVQGIAAGDNCCVVEKIRPPMKS